MLRLLAVREGGAEGLGVGVFELATGRESAPELRELQAVAIGREMRQDSPDNLSSDTRASIFRLISGRVCRSLSTAAR